MATITGPRPQRPAVLADITPKQNISQVKQSSKERKAVRFDQVSSPPQSRYPRRSKNKPTGLALLELQSINSDNPAATYSLENSSPIDDMPNFVDSPYPLLHSSNMSKPRDKNATRLRPSTPASPRTPPVAQCGGESLVEISESGVMKVPAPVGTIVRSWLPLNAFS
jgi:hypothetical protein